MAIEYQRNTWETGKVITAKALNDIETGIVNIVEKLNSMDGEVASQTLKVEGNASIGGTATVTGEATFNGPVEIKGATTINGATIIKGATTINNDITVGTDNHIILSASPNENNHAVTKGYVDGQISTINNKTINSGNTGIVSSGKLGVDDGITITLQPATSEALGGIKVGDKLSFTNNVLNLPVASISVLGGIKVGTNLSINDQGVLSATDTTYALANTTTAGLMSATHFNKLENNVVTGISINGGTTQSPTNGVVNINVLTEHQDISSKANLNSPTFTGRITLGATSIEEPALQKLNVLPQIPSLADDANDGIYVLQANKTTPEGATEPVITYSWIPVPEQESGGEGS